MTVTVYENVKLVLNTNGEIHIVFPAVYCHEGLGPTHLMSFIDKFSFSDTPKICSYDNYCNAVRL
jgi:hypothetical protein